MKGSQQSLLIEISYYKTSGKSKNKIGGRRPDGHITNPRNTRVKETSSRQTRMGASSEGDQGPEGAVAPQMEGTG